MDLLLHKLESVFKSLVHRIELRGLELSPALLIQLEFVEFLVTRGRILLRLDLLLRSVFSPDLKREVAVVLRLLVDILQRIGESLLALHNVLGRPDLAALTRTFSRALDATNLIHDALDFFAVPDLTEDLG